MCVTRAILHLKFSALLRMSVRGLLDCFAVDFKAALIQYAEVQGF